MLWAYAFGYKKEIVDKSIESSHTLKGNEIDDKSALVCDVIKAGQFDSGNKDDIFLR